MNLRAVLLVSFLGVGAQVPAATFTVTSTADNAGASCGATCTLRQALTAANSAAGTDTIAFNIPGTGPHRITLTAALPVSSNLVIDGLSQPNAEANTHSDASNAVLQIIIDGRALTQTLFAASNLTVRGLSILGPPAHVTLQLAGGTVSGNWFGVEPDGSTTVAHALSVEMNGPAAHLVGGSTVADRNVFVAAGTAINFQSAATGTNTVRGNLLGLLPDGVTPATVGTAVNAIGAVTGQSLIDNTIGCTTGFASRNFGSLVQGNRFGSTANGSGNPGCNIGVLQTTSNRTIVGNTFAHYTTTAVSLGAGISGVVFQGNRIIGGSAVPFDLNGNGFTGNDGDDSDSGANGLQNHPVITESLRIDADQVQLAGSLRSTPNTSFALQFFAAPEITRAAAGSIPLANAERVATTLQTVSTDATGLASFGPLTVSFDGSGVLGAVVGIATRLDAGGTPVESSEYGEARAVYAATSGDFVVTNTASSGSGSLFRALLEAEARPDAAGRDRIVFAIPGAGPHVLGNGVLPNPVLNGRLEIDGYTQSGSRPNDAQTGSNAELQVVLSGMRLAFGNDDVLLRGLVLQGQSALLALTGGAIEGSFIGVSTDGSSIASTAGNTAQLVCSGPCRIGGAALAQRNVIGCPQQLSNFSCLAIQAGGSSGGAVIEGNLIGVTASGLLRLVTPNDGGSSAVPVGVLVSRQFTAVRGNVIGGLVNGIRGLGVGNIVITDNRIGLGADDSAPVGNARHGIVLDNATATISGNHIAHNGRDGVQVGIGSVLSGVIENVIRDNGELAVDLNISGSASVFGDGVSPNDPGDTDTFANGGQNFPVLSNVRRSAAGIQGEISLDSVPNRQFRLRYCYLSSADPSGHGECAQPVSGIVQVINTDASGQFSGLTPLLPATMATRLTATAARVQGSFEESSEFAANVVIADVTQTSLVSSDPNPSVFGQTFTVTVQVSGLSATPTGTVLVSSATGGSCVATLSSGTGSCALLVGAAGEQVLTADYAGAVGFAASTGSAAHSVQRAPTLLQITSDTPDPSTFGDAITVNYSVVSTPVATGSVTIVDGVGGQCSGALNGTGQGSCVLTPGAGGPLTLTASYAQTANFAASSGTEAHQVNAVASTLAILSDTPDPSVTGQPVTVSAQLSSAVGTPAGPIQISDGAGASCQISGASGACQLVPINAGTVVLRADFGGTPTHLQSTASDSHQVDRASTLLTAGTALDIDGFPPRQFALMRFPVAIAAVAPGAGLPSGTITVTGTAGVESCTLSLPAPSCDLVVQTPGLRTFQIDYAGDARYAPSSTQVNAEVLPDALFANGLEGEDPP